MFNELAELMELHGENPFKHRSYTVASQVIRKMDAPALGLSMEELLSLKGIGTAIAAKIHEIGDTGKLALLEKFRSMTPVGVREMLKVKGIGPSKVRSIWRDMGIETPGELAYACEENRLAATKGFGQKLQETIRQGLAFALENSGKFLYSTLSAEATSLISAIRAANPGVSIEICGELRRAELTLQAIELLIASTDWQLPVDLSHQKEDNYLWKEYFPVRIYVCDKLHFGYELAQRTSGSEVFVQNFLQPLAKSELFEEQALFEANGMKWIPPECRDLNHYGQFDATLLVDADAIRGVIHTHSKYSDGACSIGQLARECMRLGYTYLVVSDHSRSAFYANGLSIERVEQQWREIDQLNKDLAPFRIFKSIESDILSDGSLDYPDDVLDGFDLVIASVHSQMKMDEQQATERLLRAIRHPRTRILGHMTGRLLLSRPGYPLHIPSIIEACAERGVCIELNANPMRLDIDWNWIPEAMERKVLISINPDAHNLSGIRDISYGVIAARKGGLVKNLCLNCRSLSEFISWIGKKSNF